jgi:hypothetical protein
MASSLDEILQRLSSLPNANFWSVLVTEPEQQEQALIELEESIHIFIDEAVNIIAITSDIEALIQSVQASESYILLWQFDIWQPEQWQQFDYARSRFSHDKGGIILLTPHSAAQFQIYAPNFASWIGSRVYDLQLGLEILTEAESQQRLEALQQFTGKTDVEVIRLAETGQLPRDPEYGEWLVLLGRGDLLERTINVAEL